MEYSAARCDGPDLSKTGSVERVSLKSGAVRQEQISPRPKNFECDPACGNAPNFGKRRSVEGIGIQAINLSSDIDVCSVAPNVMEQNPKFACLPHRRKSRPVEGICPDAVALVSGIYIRPITPHPIRCSGVNVPDVVETQFA